MNPNEKENKSQAERNIQWHPAFWAAAEIELRFNKDELEFKSEYNLSQKPLQIDLLIVEKRKNVPIQNEIGHIFRKHNIIEYKSPEDGLSIDDFCKTVAYAYLYKSLAEKVDQIPLQELTVSLFRFEKPSKLMNMLKDCGCRIEKYANGIYYVKGLLIPAQIIVVRELNAAIHSCLRVLSRNVTKKDIQIFTEYVRSFTEPGEKEKADAIVQVSVSANKEIYEEVRRNPTMCEALRELMKEEIEEELEKARKEGNSRGREEGEGRISSLYKKLLQDGRQEDVSRMMEDAEYRAKLFAEYGIE